MKLLNNWRNLFWEDIVINYIKKAVISLTCEYVLAFLQL